MILGAINWFNNEKGFGTIQTVCSGTVFLHINSFYRRPLGELKRKQIVAFKKKTTTDQGESRATGCKLLETSADFGFLMTLLGQKTMVDIRVAKGNKTSEPDEEHYCLLKHGTLQLFSDRPERSFIDTVIHYFDKQLEEARFIQFCRYLEEIAIPLIKTDDREMLEQTLYCHFYANLTAGILFQAWKHHAFRYIAYTEGMDYEIPEEIIIAHRDELGKAEWDRIRQYSYGPTFFSSE